MIVYFSATGNSRYCASYLSRRLGDPAVDSTEALRRQEALTLSSQASPGFFVCPTYAWQIPRVFAALLRRSTFTGSRAAYFVMTCGGETGNAQAGLREPVPGEGPDLSGALSPSSCPTIMSSCSKPPAPGRPGSWSWPPGPGSKRPPGPSSAARPPRPCR